MSFGSISESYKNGKKTNIKARRENNKNSSATENKILLKEPRHNYISVRTYLTELEKLLF